MIPDKKRAAAEARALKSALVLAGRMDWQISRRAVPLSCFAQFLYIEAAQLLLVPTTAGLAFAMRQVDPLMRETRSDAIIVSRLDAGPPAFAFAAWERDATRWLQPLELWFDATGATWLAPVDGGSGRGVRLTSGLHCAAMVPWTSEDERQVGRHRALGWLARSD